MTFIWPVLLLSLLLLPPAVGLYLRQQQRRRRLAASYGSLGFVQAAGGRLIYLCNPIIHENPRF